MNNSNENNERKSEIKVEPRAFKVSEPLGSEQRVLMYREVLNTMEKFHAMDILFDKRFPEDIPDRNVKRAFAMASKMAEFVVEYLEKTGCCINMDSQAMQGVLTPLLLPGPIIACDAISEVDSYINNKETEND